MRILFAFCFLLSGVVQAQTQNLWESHEYESYNETILPYRLLPPPVIEEGQTYPLVIFLHGAGERGANNKDQLKHVSKSFEEKRIRAAYPAFVLFPQLRKRNTWSNGVYTSELATVSLENQAGNYLSAVMDVIDQLEEDHPIDPERIYIGGLSMGGFGTWDALSRWPWRFAAAFPICGAGDPSTVDRFAHIPIWVFHGEDDAVVPVEASRLMVDHLRNAGSKVIYTEFPKVNHNSWDPAFETRHLLDWLFAQERTPYRSVRSE